MPHRHYLITAGDQGSTESLSDKATRSCHQYLHLYKFRGNDHGSITIVCKNNKKGLYPPFDRYSSTLIFS